MKDIIAAGLLFLGVGVGCAPTVAPPPAPTPPPEAAPTTPAPTDLTAPVPDFYRQALANGTRAESGAPGPAYWQNSVSYRIEAELDPETATIHGSERIVYRNNSPHELPSVVLNLYQNVFAEGVPRNRYVPITGGVTLERVMAQGEELPPRTPAQLPIMVDRPNDDAGFSVQGTLGRVRLPQPLATGDSVVLEIDWTHAVPPAPNFRTGWEDALGARAFHVAQWYPQIATFDDLRGWDATPYLGDGEFYLAYGDFDVSITVPAGYLVAATGELANPEEVLTDEARSRLTAALASDTITRVVTRADLAAENATQASPGGQLTWRFTADDVRDFAFSTSGGYVWDATSVDGSGTGRIAVHALYRPGAPHWENAARYAQHSTKVIDGLLIPYLYPQVTVAEGPVGGMEYPMVAFIGKPSTVEGLYGVIAHEIAHEWFPMMVGTDEAAYAWMDEGAANFLEAVAAGEFFGREDPFTSDLASYLNIAGSEFEVPLMRHTDLVTPYGSRGVSAYTKPAVLLRSLQFLMGEEQFREALNSYATEWLLRHPAPWDFFSTMERFADQDLGWFFGPWWHTTGVLDRAITRVELSDTSAVVTIENHGRLTAPAILVARLADGGTLETVVPVDQWFDGRSSIAVELEATSPIVEIIIDPEQIFPDADPSKNVWRAAGR